MALDNSVTKWLVSLPESIPINNFKFRVDILIKISEFDSADNESKN